MYFIWLLLKMKYAYALLSAARCLHIGAEKLRRHSVNVVASVNRIVNP